MNVAGCPTTAAAVLALAVCFTGSLNSLAQEEGSKSRLVITHYGGNYRGLTAETENLLYVRVTNAGTRDLKGIRLSATAPKSWVILIEPDTLDLPAGSSGTATVRVTPLAGAAGGQHHTIACVAESPTVRESTVVHVTVQRSPRFLRTIGAVIALVVVAGLIFVYLRYGRG